MLLTLLASACALLPPQQSASQPLLSRAAVQRTSRLLASVAEPTVAGAAAKDVFADQRGNLALLDAEAMLAAQAFPMSPDELIAKAKDFISADYGGADTSWLADDFQFVGPFVGPLNRQQYVDALGGNLNPSSGFPDLVGRQFGFAADPLEPGRVWWVTRPTGTFTRPFFGAEPDGRRVETPPQAMGVIFNTQGRVVKINVGAVMDRTSGNTGGLGGLFGFLHFVGKSPPAPEYQPYKRSWQFKLLNSLAPLLTKLQAEQEAQAKEAFAEKDS